jgi:hypothetical protein
MFKFNQKFASLGSSKTVKISEALDPEERKAIIESTVGMKIRGHSQMDSRLPATWE